MTKCQKKKKITKEKYGGRTENCIFLFTFLLIHGLELSTIFHKLVSEKKNCFQIGSNIL